MPQSAVLLLLTIGVLSVLALQMLAARRGPSWLGAVMPAMWAGAVLVLLVTGKVAPGRPMVVAAAGLVLLLWLWASGRQARARAAIESVSTVAGRSV